jgi:hypothetical protein
MCKTGKRRHPNRIAAIITMKKINNRALNAYWCPTCKGWHLGHSNQDWRMQERIDQLLGLRK